jgi:hypothetical protein
LQQFHHGAGRLVADSMLVRVIAGQLVEPIAGRRLLFSHREQRDLFPTFLQRQRDQKERRVRGIGALERQGARNGTQENRRC